MICSANNNIFVSCWLWQIWYRYIKEKRLLISHVTCVNITPVHVISPSNCEEATCEKHYSANKLFFQCAGVYCAFLFEMFLLPTCAQGEKNQCQNCRKVLFKSDFFGIPIWASAGKNIILPLYERFSSNGKEGVLNEYTKGLVITKKCYFIPRRHDCRRYLIGVTNLDCYSGPRRAPLCSSLYLAMIAEYLFAAVNHTIGHYFREAVFCLSVKKWSVFYNGF